MKIFKYLLPLFILFLFEIAVGVLLIINGEMFTQVVFIIFGVFMLICGIVTLIRTLMKSRNGGSISMLSLIGSIILLSIGAFFTAASGSVLSVMTAVTLVIGIIMVFNGMLKLAEYAAMRKQDAGSVFAIIGAIVTIVLGIVIAFNPFKGFEVMVMWMILGIMIIVSAVFDLISLISFAVALKKTNVTVIEVNAKDVDE